MNHIEVYLRDSKQPRYRQTLQRWSFHDEAPYSGMSRERLRFSKIDSDSTAQVAYAVRDRGRWLED